MIALKMSGNGDMKSSGDMTKATTLDLVKEEVEQAHKGSLRQHNRGNLDLVEEEVEPAHRGSLGQHNRGNLDLIEEEVEQATEEALVKTTEAIST